MGGHGDTMVPLPRYTTVGGISVTELIDAGTSTLSLSVRRRVVVKSLTLGTSAWYAPGAAAAQMVEAIVKDQKRVFPACVWMTGEYGIEDMYLGVPVILGKNGVEKVIELDLNEEERELLVQSEKAVREVKAVLDNMND